MLNTDSIMITLLYISYNRKYYENDYIRYRDYKRKRKSPVRKISFFVFIAIAKVYESLKYL